MHDERFGFWFAGPRGPRGFHGRRGHGRGGWGGGAPGGGDRRDDWASMFRERPPRAERGGVRYLVLDAIAEQPRHGYEIMSAIAERSGGSYKPSPGVVYPTLQMLEELGHVKVTDREDRKVYTITTAGKTELDAHRDEVDAFYEQSEDVWDDHADELREFMLRIRGLVRAFRRSARRGRLTPTMMRKVRGILDEAISKLESAADE